LPDPKQEAELIVNALFEDYGTGGHTTGEVPGIDGREAIQEMKKEGFPGWQEVEWAGYHIKYLIQKECELKLQDRIRPYNLRKRHLVKGNYVWDVRFSASDKINIILGGVDEYKDIIESSNGIGLLVVDAVVNYDLNEDFRRWHEELKGGSSGYSIEREMEGRSPRLRKTAYMIRKIIAYFFSVEDLTTGITEGWLNDTFQHSMRNSDGSSRKPKYLLKINDVPRSKCLLVKNFNEDPEEFEEDFPEYA
jgi:hypothetical protein